MFCCLSNTQAQRAQWMQEARWGVMNHYLADWMARSEGFQMNVDKWNEMVNNFYVEGLANQLQKVGASYYGNLQKWYFGSLKSVNHKHDI